MFVLQTSAIIRSELLNLWPKKLDVGRWTLDVGRWTLDVGRWTIDSGLQATIDYLFTEHRLVTRD